MITDYLNQNVTWQAYLGTTDSHGDKQYSPTVNTIKARKRRIRIDEQDRHSSLFSTQFVIHTESLVNIGDKIDSLEVTRTTELVNYAGVVIGVVGYI